MSSTTYLSKIKAKYGIKDGNIPTKFVTLDDHNQDQRQMKIKNQLMLMLRNGVELTVPVAML